ncbi:uncharacterized protein [Macrobrachium rosenbergii]|uniref:uncharacterized protein n=1 Tax=Macrobrachium rosenbergii TaxID=79674 RepID=UPI0034D4EB93
MIEAGNSTSTQEKSETEVNVQETADKDKSENEGTVTKDEESNTPMKHSVLDYETGKTCHHYCHHMKKLPDHLDNVGKWKELEQRLKKHKTIDDETQRARERVEIIGNKSWNDLLPYTPDVSHVEQVTVIIRFVQVDEDNAVIAVREHSLGYVPLQETTGACMAETILEDFKKMDLCIDNLRGQGYDNGSNMKASTHRWDVLKRHVQSLTVKPLSETRWESRIDALKPIRYQIGDIYDALTEMATDSTLLGSSGNSTHSVRLGKKKRQFDYEGEDTPVQNAKVNFKVNFYFAILDVAINSVLERFQQLQQMKSVFGFLYDVKSLNGITNTQLMEHCTKLEKALRDGESKDIDATDLCHELQAVARRLQPDTVIPWMF